MFAAKSMFGRFAPAIGSKSSSLFGPSTAKYFSTSSLLKAPIGHDEEPPDADRYIHQMLSTYPEYSASRPNMDRQDYVESAAKMGGPDGGVRDAYIDADKGIGAMLDAMGLGPTAYDERSHAAIAQREKNIATARANDPNQRRSETLDLGDIMFPKPTPEKRIESTRSKVTERLKSEANGADLSKEAIDKATYEAVLGSAQKTNAKIPGTKKRQ